MLTGLILTSFLFFIAASSIVILVVILISQVISGRGGAPYVPIRRKLIMHLLGWAGLSSGDIIYDLGCGDGRVLVSAVRDFDAKMGVGYEIAPWPYLKAGLMVRLAGLDNKIKILCRSFFEIDLHRASFIYIYLFPELVDQLAFKMAKELRFGTKILCPSFPIDLARHQEFKLLKTAKFDKIVAYLYTLTPK